MLINSKMQKYLDELEQANIKESRYDIHLNSIDPFIFPTFIEWDGCILLKQKNGPDLPSHFIPSEFTIDRTAFEALHNHIHLDDIFENMIEPIQLFGIGVKMIEIWAAVLYRQFNGKRNFYVILSYDGEYSVLRFYSVRQDEPPWIIVDLLDSYLDAVMVIEV